LQYAPDPPSGEPASYLTSSVEPAGVADPASDKLRRLLGGEPTAWIVQRARDRLETGRPLAGSITLPGASPQQRRAVERLTGRSARSGTSVSVSLPEIDRILRDSGAAPGGLAEAVTRLVGPLQDRRLAQAETEAAWRAAFAELDSVLLEQAQPIPTPVNPLPTPSPLAPSRLAPSPLAPSPLAPSPLAAWRAWLDATGLVRRLAPDPSQAQVLLSAVAAVLRRLPSRGIPIGRLAAECCGDAHALDDGRPVGTVALSAARALVGLPFAGDGTADSRRAAWAAVGVHLDDLSSLVLCVGLPGDTRTPLGRILATCREAGQPAMLTLRQLRCHDEPVSAGFVRICENPVVVAAAADELGARCQPLVCVSGQPSAAAWRLLELLSAGGATFAYHGDFDWGGVRIAAAVHDRVTFQPWRYDACSYEAAVSAARPVPAALVGEPVETPWDPPLSAAMRRHGVRIEEELVLDALLQDQG
jgi:uncharacterized protein (TIGR02679 family)